LVALMVILLIVANVINIGADIGAMADAMHLLVPALSFSLLAVLFGVVILVLEIYLTYRTYAEILKWLCLSLFSYLFTLVIVTTDWGKLLWAMVTPKIQWTREYMLALIAVFGTTISPYLFFWQASEEIEEEISDGEKTVRERQRQAGAELRVMREDTALGMFFSQFIMVCIIGTAAAVFFKNGLWSVETTSQAVAALAPLAGKYAAWLYTLGIVGVGLLAVPILSAAAAYGVAEMLGWSEGLSKNFSQARGFYLVIVAATVVGMLLNWLGLNPIKALFWAAVVNGVVSIPLLWLILRMANNKQIVGKNVNGWWSNFFGVAALVLAVASVVMIVVL
jgi:Mn2+/Fe2+ NRAMP family transporter